MTFPITFPYIFGQTQSGLPITGWWAELTVALANPGLAVSSSAGLKARLGLANPGLAAARSAGLRAQLALADPALAVSSTAGFGLLEGLNLTEPNVTVSSSAGLSARLGLTNPGPTVSSSAALRAQLGSTNPGIAATSTAGLITQVGLANPSLTVAGSVGFSLIPTYDNSAKISARPTALASGTPFTWSSGGGTAGAYGLVFVDCLGALMNLTATAVVTWGGVPMTSLGAAYNNNNATGGWGWLFALPGVAAGGAGIPGGAQTISVTLTQSGQTFTGWGSSYSYTGVSSAGTLHTAYGTGTSPAVVVPAANATDIVWGAIASSETLSTFSLTTRQDVPASNPPFWAGDTTGSTSVTVGATALGGGWSAFGLDLQ